MNRSWYASVAVLLRSASSNASQRALEPRGGEPPDEPILRFEEAAIHELEHPFDATARPWRNSSLLPSGLPIDLSEVEVHAEDDRQRAEPREGEPRTVGRRAEHDEQEGVEGSVRLGVEVAPEQGHAAGQASEAPVRVVEKRLQLEQRSSCNERSQRERDTRGDPDGGRHEHHGRWRYPRRCEKERKAMGERTEGERDHELPRGAILGRDLRSRQDGALGRHGHRMRSIVDTAGMADPDGWNEVDDALERTFELASFRHALDFVNRVGELAEREGHHPDIAVHYKEVTLRWWTHTAGGVTDRDRELARKTNALG